MDKIKAQISEKNGKKEFAIPAYEDFLKIQKQLENCGYLRRLREAKDAERNDPTISLPEVRQKLMNDSPKTTS